ncbi:MAG: hypothetical protein CMD99_06620 [Gammaproteobacteria bacterium]|nr:hypothetical protein [Gammaproteobacteria bacterium]
MRSALRQRSEVRRLERLMLQRFELPSGTMLSVEEHWPRDPGFPARMSMLSFWLEDVRHGFTVFKRLEEVDEGDVPPGWMKHRLIRFEPMGCSCC